MGGWAKTKTKEEFITVSIWQKRKDENVFWKSECKWFLDFGVKEITFIAKSSVQSSNSFNSSFKKCSIRETLNHFYQY